MNLRRLEAMERGTVIKEILTMINERTTSVRDKSEKRM
jgi:hypothetical protein